MEIENKSLRKAKILLVEDSPTQAMQTMRLLEENGFTDIIHAVNGMKALLQIRNEKPDLILSDVLMSEMDGFQLCQAIRVDPDLQDIPIILQTAAYQSHEDQAFGLDTGANAYIPKGSSAEDLISLLQKIFSQKKRKVDRGTQKAGIVQNEFKDLHEQRMLFNLIEKTASLEQANTLLEESDNRFKSIAEISGEWIWETDPEGLFTYSNPVVEQILGYRVDEMVGKKSFSDTFAPEYKKELTEAVNTIRSRRKPHHGFIHQNLNKSGLMVILETNCLPIINHSGEFLGFRGVNINITEREQEQALITEQVETLDNLYYLSSTLSGVNDYKKIFDLVTLQAVKAAHVTFAKILLLEQDDLVTRSAYPARNLDGDLQLGQRIPLADLHVFRRALNEGVPLLIQADSPEIEECGRFAVDGTQTLCIVKIQTEKRFLGLLMLGEMRDPEREPLTMEKVRLASSIADQLVSALNRAILIQDLKETLLGTIETIALIVEARDPYTSGHQKRVAEISAAISKEMDLPEEQSLAIYMAGLIHDLGKIQVPSEILSKPGKLSELEFNLIKNHPQVGYDLLKKIDFPWPIARIILQHHEKMNGSGYPRGLKAEEILLEARILAVADIVEAMSSFRPYRSALGIEKALAQIKMDRGTLLDADVVDACLKIFNEGYQLSENWRKPSF